MVYIDLPTADRVVVIGDLHGDISTLCSCLYMTNIINSNLEWIAQPSNTIVVQIGDQVDSLSRNEVNQNWEKISDYSLIKFTDRIDEIAKKKGGRFISLIGNHEIMNVLNCFEYVSELSMRKSGGHYGRSKKFSPGGELAKILAKRPVIQKIGPLLFCHAGLLPHHLNIVNSNIG
ncbi:MAG: metallophosphoesterase, partial [Minisyncoccia bacterium]